MIDLDSLINATPDQSAPETVESATPAQIALMRLHADPVPNGTFTVTRIGHGDKHFTVRFSTQADKAKFAAGQRIIALMNGSDNTNDFQSFAFLKANGAFNMWRRFADSTRMRSLADCAVSLLKDGEASRFHAQGYRIQGESRCIRCGRKITHPVSLETNIGPVCATKM